MHELSIAQGIMDVVEAERRKHGFGAVHVVRLRLGALSGVDEDALRFAFETIRDGTCAAAATLDVASEQGMLTCRKCGARTPADDRPTACPSCGSADLAFEGGMDLDIVSLEVDTDGEDTD